ncbi:hypothetical protein MJO28_008441 [Puccinia striiformis f. sp. tritici]|uniref:glucan 1,3-beta-glucosidase n=3 Tax=Puccinia striiformis TaxID=27350 RepID=A0A0L0UWG3_9BASI|nr:hypothetical protein Pst134EB_033521 [Puccinia striiformis f. sp. tritici]KAI7949620.1 hypothetical protein MJO28_008441 [Puccinia striiformis f. sp. tritici]KNE91365.1 hypothetical protein PSTG_15230 [Puccinia striiformis f. sp. tritici PST-78]POW07388.1 hypothetical protein PSTT_08314 [Puccinia striiformis]
MSEDIPLTAPTHPRDPYDVIYEGSEHQATPRFLGAAMRDYRPVSGLSNYTDTSSLNSRIIDDTYDPSAPFMPDPGEDPSGTQSRTGLTTNVTSKEYDPNSFDDQINSGNGSPKKKSRNRLIGCIAITVALGLILAVILGSVFGTRSNKNKLADGSEDHATAGSGGASAGKGGKLWGVGGDTIKTEDGHSFLYNNTFGGTWVSIPFNDTARAQGDQPSLEETWDYSNNRMLGVNLGGWLVLEPFITPSLFEPYANSAHPVVDEWTLCETLGTKAASTIENHYKTFITEQDFADIASAGLNWVRLPVAWWMIETLGNEPFVTGVSFKYFLKAITWARKYGLRINLDLHACPGSQNGWNHSGKLGTIGFLRGTMGIANAQRTLNYVRTLTQFISQSQYKHVIPTFSVLNEAQTGIIGSGAMRSWYYQVYQMIRNIGGTGTGNGPFMVIHDGFSGPNSWNGFLQGADRLGLDTHTYFCFGNQNTDTAAMNSIKPCQQLASFANSTMGGFGLSITGEFSLAINDCGLYVNNVGSGTRFEGTYPNATAPDAQYKRVGSCDQWLDDRQWTPEMKNGFADMAQTQQDVMRNSFFWTWKIGPSTKQDNVPNPMWNYQGGLRNSYIRQDARGSNGRCAAVSAAQGVTYAPKIVSGDLDTWQVGGQGAGQILASEVQKYSQFPPDVIGGGPGGLNYPAASLHRYVASGNPVTLVPSPVANGANHITAGSGWTNSQDTAKSWIAQPGCQYPDPWGGVSAPAPIHPCGI